MLHCFDHCLSHLFQVISVDDDVQSTKLGQPELILIHTGVADFLPGAGAVCLAGRLHSWLELVQPHQAAGQAAIVGNVGKQDAGCLIQTLIKDPVTYTLHSIKGTVNVAEANLLVEVLCCPFASVLHSWWSAS